MKVVKVVIESGLPGGIGGGSSAERVEEYSPMQNYQYQCTAWRKELDSYGPLPGIYWYQY